MAVIGVTTIFKDVEYLVVCEDPSCGWEKLVVDPVSARHRVQELIEEHGQFHREKAGSPA